LPRQARDEQKRKAQKSIAFAEMVEVLHRFFPQYSDQIVQPTDCSPSAEESTEGPKCGEKRSLSFRSRDFRTENDLFLASQARDNHQVV
jgi:hypothetical protein